MAKTKNQDELDQLKADYEHVGRHRARKSPRDRWMEFLRLAVASMILSTAGYFGLQYAVNSAVKPTPAPVIVKGVDYSTPITVIDGSGTRQYAIRMGQVLLNAKLVVPYSRTLDFEFPTSSINIQDEKYRPLAKKIQKSVGILPIKVVSDSKYPIEVRLGQDFQLPE